MSIESTETLTHSLSPDLSSDFSSPTQHPRAAVTPRSFVVGLGLSAGLAALNSWIETVAEVHFLGGTQIPFGAIFALLILVLVVNGPLRALQRILPLAGRIFLPLTSAELVTIYVMTLSPRWYQRLAATTFFLLQAPLSFTFLRAKTDGPTSFTVLSPNISRQAGTV